MLSRLAPAVLLLAGALAGSLRWAHGQDHACHRPVATAEGPCSFEQVTGSVGNGTAFPDGCRALIDLVSRSPDSYTADCVPGVLLSLLLFMTTQHDAVAAARSITTLMPIAFEMELHYSAIRRLWPRAFPGRWEAAWRLHQHRQQVEAFYERGVALWILEASCFRSVRAEAGVAGGPEWAREAYPRRRLNGLLAELPAPPPGRCCPPPPAWAVCTVASRSQIGQDLWVLSYFGRVQGGFFLEVGANHPETMSNTYVLEKAAGWRGISVEPFPRGDWSTRSASLLQCAVGPGSKQPFILPGHMWGGLMSSANGNFIGDTVPDREKTSVVVQTRTLEDLLTSARKDGVEVPRVIHYVSLDVEGAEYDVLLQFPFEQYVPLSFTVEWHHLGARREMMHDLLAQRGYTLERTAGHDDYFLLDGYERYLGDLWQEVAA